MAVFALMMWKVRAMADNTERTAGKKNEKRNGGSDDDGDDDHHDDAAAADDDYDGVFTLFGPLGH